MSRIGKTSLAVALKYDDRSAPKVVAVGRGEFGQRIIDTAREHGVPLEANPALAEALSTIEVETEIPRELYAAVATILAFILKVSAEMPARRAPTLKP
jgi:flagellar biosynthesis protein